MLVAPSDHVVPDAAAFRAAVAAGEAAARAGQIVTFGIKPTHAETGYGYLELEGEPLQFTPDFSPRAIGLKRFVEKPDAQTAAAMLSSGRFLWNAGIFLFSVQAILAAFRAHAPGLMAPVEAAISEGAPDLGFFRLDPAAWEALEDISIDYAVMEKATNLTVVPFAAGWSDLGGWDAVWREAGPDAQGVVTSGNATAIDCHDSLLRSEDASLEVVGIGLRDVIAVAMPDAVLVADASRAQDVKLAVAALKAKAAKQATNFRWITAPGAGSRAWLSVSAFRSSASMCTPVRR